MIRRVAIKNYRCLRDVELELSPLTILVGPNASGKSSILNALTRFSLSPHDSWQHEVAPSIDFHLDSGPKLFQRGASNWDDRPYRARKLHLDLQALRSPNQVSAAQQLEENGYNLANVFATLARKQQDSIAQELVQRVPVVADVNVRPSSSGQHRLVFQDRWAPNVWYEPHEISDGTMLMLAFLVLQYEQPPVDLLAIEEPERGLHPYLLGETLSFMRKLSTGEIGARSTQIILATHSAELLEFAQPDEVRFLSRKGADVVVEKAPTSSPEWEDAFREYRESLGSVWLSGNLGGVPGGG